MTKATLACVVFVAAVGFGFAQGNTDPLSSTKADPVARPMSSDNGIPGVVQTLAALILVGAGIKWGLPKWFKPRATAAKGSSGGTLSVIETVTGSAGTYQIVEAMGRRFLVAANGNGMTLLAELSPPRFEAVLGQAAVATEQPEPEPEDIRERVAAASARLDELIGR
jgi:hypothetical protein